jgi:hypothetical protein
MPVHYCPGNGKYRIGSGPCVYNTRDDAERAYRAYLARKHGNPGHSWDKLYKAGEAEMDHGKGDD